MSENKITSDLLRGHTDTMILRLLAEADRYGYEIVKLIGERSGGEYELKEATMYSSVRRLEADGVNISGSLQRAGPPTPATRTIGSMQSACSTNYCNGEVDLMNEKLTIYLNGVFASYDGVKSVAELKADLLSDLEERFRELKAEGKDDETAFALTIDSIGDIEQTVQEVANLSRSLERKVLTNFSASNLPESDFAGVIAHKGKFEASALRGSDFSGADLTGSSFKASDLFEANFDGANLTDCILYVSDFTGASFSKTILVRTEFNTSDLTGAKFSNVRLVDVKLSMTDLRKTIFENCIFDGVDFKNCDLRELCLDGQTFLNVKFNGAALNEASFQGATLRNVSFTPPFSLFSLKKYYTALKTIRFDGASIDKLSYNALKGMGVELPKVMIV